MKQKISKIPNPVVELSSLEDFKPFDGFKAKLVHTKTQTYAFWEIKKDSVLPGHQHINEQVSIVTKGVLELTIGDTTTEMKPGMVAVIPPNTYHSGRALSDVEITDIFSPIREDFPQN